MQTAMPTWSSMDRRALLSHCQAYDARTREARCRGGTIGRSALEVLETLIFKLAEPGARVVIASVREIMRKVRLGRSAVKAATAILHELGIVTKHARAGTGLFPNDANAYEFADPRAVFRRFFPMGGGRGKAPSNSPSENLLLSSRRIRRREPEVVLAVAEAGPEPRGAMTDAAMEAAGKRALEQAAATAETQSEGPPAPTAAKGMRMQTKAVEIRDRHTFIPAIATLLEAASEPERYLMARCGFPGNGSHVVLTKLVDGSSSHDPYRWPGDTRTMRIAHRWILDFFPELEDGAVVDVEWILGETPAPRESEAGR